MTQAALPLCFLVQIETFWSKIGWVKTRT
jgi:hypothetical protein